MTSVQLLTRTGRLADVGVSDAGPASRSPAAPTFRPTTATAGLAFKRVLLTLAEAWKTRARRHRRGGRRHHGRIRSARPARSRERRATSTHELLAAGAGRSGARVRLGTRRLRPGAEVSASDGPAPAACASWQRFGDDDALHMVAAHARPHGDGRHLRSSRRRLRPLQHRRPLARAALRENALRQRPARARAIWRRFRRRASRSIATSPRRRSAGCCAR